MKLKGYYTHYGYMGFTKNGRMLFATESEYIEYMRESEDRA